MGELEHDFAVKRETLTNALCSHLRAGSKRGVIALGKHDGNVDVSDYFACQDIKRTAATVGVKTLERRVGCNASGSVRDARDAERGGNT